MIMEWLILQGPLPITIFVVEDVLERKYSNGGVYGTSYAASSVNQYSNISPNHHTWEAHGCVEERQDFHLDEICYSSGWDFEDWYSISCKFWYLILHVYCYTLFANVNALAIVELFKNLFSNASYFWRWIWFVFKTELEKTYLNGYSKES